MPQASLFSPFHADFIPIGSEIRDPVVCDQILLDMVFSTGCSSNTDFDATETQMYVYSHYTAPRKRLKMLVTDLSASETSLCIGNIGDGASSLLQHMDGCMSNGCSADVHGATPSCDPLERVGSHAAMEGTCESTNNGGDDAQPCSISETACQDKSYSGYAQAASVSGWMYINQCGQMSGPYIQEQLYEGLSTGFLPEELPVYPVVNGSVINPVPLKYFKQFPDHVATGFVYWSAGYPATVPSRDNEHVKITSSDNDVVSGYCNQRKFNGYATSSVNLESHSEQQTRIMHGNRDIEVEKANIQLVNLQSSEESCWIFEDGAITGDDICDITMDAFAAHTPGSTGRQTPSDGEELLDSHPIDLNEDEGLVNTESATFVDEQRSTSYKLSRFRPSSDEFGQRSKVRKHGTGDCLAIFLEKMTNVVEKMGSHVEVMASKYKTKGRADEERTNRVCKNVSDIPNILPHLIYPTIDFIIADDMRTSVFLGLEPHIRQSWLQHHLSKIIANIGSTTSSDFQPSTSAPTVAPFVASSTTTAPSSITVGMNLQFN